MTKKVQLLHHYNLKKSLRLLELMHNKKILNLTQTELVMLNNNGKIIFFSFCVNPGNKNNKICPRAKGLPNKRPV